MAILGILACMVGCATLQIRDQLARASGRPIVLVDGAWFDGEYLNGRMLVGTDDAGYVVVDRRLPELNVIVVDTILDCDGGETVDYIAADALAKSPGPEDYLTIEPGYWYGRDFHLLMYAEEKARTPAPACIDAVLALNLEAAAPGASRPRLTVRAYLNRPDGGTSSTSCR